MICLARNDSYYLQVNLTKDHDVHFKLSPRDKSNLRNIFWRTLTQQRNIMEELSRLEMQLVLKNDWI